MSNFDVVLAMMDKENQKRRDTENSGRLAFSMHTVETKGVGQIRHVPVDFHVIFTQEPVVLTGSSVGKVGGDVDPMAQASVRRWIRNRNGHYVGFQPVFRIDLFLVQEAQTISDVQALQKLAASCTMIHHFAFAGQAYKDMGDAVRQAYTIPVREVNF